MSTPPHVRVEPADAPRVGDLPRFPGQRRPVKRYAEMATIPWKPRYGTPTPDAGYALRLAERFEPRLELTATERTDDALWAGSILAMQRAGRAGRGPIPADVEVGLTALGYLGGAPQEMAAWRARELAGIRSEYHLQRRLAERVGYELLELTAPEIREHLHDWQSVFDVEAGADPRPVSDSAEGKRRAGPRFHRPRRATRRGRAEATGALR